MGASLEAWAFLRPTGSRRDQLEGCAGQPPAQSSGLSGQRWEVRSICSAAWVFLRRPLDGVPASHLHPTPWLGHRDAGKKPAGFCCSAQASGGCRAGGPAT